MRRGRQVLKKGRSCCCYCCELPFPFMQSAEWISHHKFSLGWDPIQHFLFLYNSNFLFPPRVFEQSVFLFFFLNAVRTAEFLKKPPNRDREWKFFQLPPLFFINISFSRAEYISRVELVVKLEAAFSLHFSASRAPIKNLSLPPLLSVSQQEQTLFKDLRRIWNSSDKSRQEKSF